MDLEGGQVVLHREFGAQLSARRRYLHEDPAESPALVGAAAIQQRHARRRVLVRRVGEHDDRIAIDGSPGGDVANNRPRTVHSSV